jgi:baculoviral IAP repeat-containing protein 6
MRDQNGKLKHHYSSSAGTGSTSTVKMIRLAQELADLSNSLPIEHTNSIFVRCDK